MAVVVGVKIVLALIFGTFLSWQLVVAVVVITSKEVFLLSVVKDGTQSSDSCSISIAGGLLVISVGSEERFNNRVGVGVSRAPTSR